MGSIIFAILASGSMMTSGVTFREVGPSLEIAVDGKPFTTYHFGADVDKPFFWPIASPFGGSLTRGFPNVPESAEETSDHRWHRGLSFTHGEVGVPGSPLVDFWREGAPNQGKIVHRGFDPRPEVKQGTLTFGARNEWVGPDGAVLLDESTLWKVDDLGGGSARISSTIRLTSRDRPIRLGDSEEGSFSVRVATSMDEKSEPTGPRSNRPRGRVSNSRGGVGASECWGLPADWVDYSGLVEGKLVGLAIFDHPENRPRAHWHVRDYGLFGANPFGQKVFKGGNEAEVVTLGPGRSLVLRYAVLVHPGDPVEGEVARRLEDYLRDERAGLDPRSR